MAKVVVTESLNALTGIDGFGTDLPPPRPANALFCLNALTGIDGFGTARVRYFSARSPAVLMP